MDLGRPRVGCPWDKSQILVYFCIGIVVYFGVVHKLQQRWPLRVGCGEKCGRKMNVAPKKEQHLRQAEEATAWPGHCVARVGENKHVEAFFTVFFFTCIFVDCRALYRGTKSFILISSSM